MEDGRWKTLYGPRREPAPSERARIMDNVPGLFERRGVIPANAGIQVYWDRMPDQVLDDQVRDDSLGVLSAWNRDHVREDSLKVSLRWIPGRARDDGHGARSPWIPGRARDGSWDLVALDPGSEPVPAVIQGPG